MTPAKKQDLPRLNAKFDDDDARYGYIEEVKYPVLLRSFLIGSNYAEDVNDEDEYGEAWCRSFYAAMMSSRHIIVAKDISANDWPFEALWSVDNVRLSNFLTCRLRKRIARLNPY